MVESCADAMCLRSTDDPDQLAYFNGTGGDVTMLIVVEGYYSAETGPVQLTAVEGETGQGDECTDAVDVSSLSSWSGSYHDYSDVWEGDSGCRYANGPEVWFTATVPGGNTFTLRETSSTDVVIHSVSSCSSTSCLWSSDTPETFTYSNPSSSSVVLYLAVERYFSGSEGPIAVSVTNTR